MLENGPYWFIPVQPTPGVSISISISIRDSVVTSGDASSNAWNRSALAITLPLKLGVGRPLCLRRRNDTEIETLLSPIHSSVCPLVVWRSFYETFGTFWERRKHLSCRCLRTSHGEPHTCSKDKWLFVDHLAPKAENRRRRYEASKYTRKTVMETKYALLWWWYSQKDLNRLFQVLASITRGSAIIPPGIFLRGSFNLTDKWILYGSVKGRVSLLSLSYVYHRNENRLYTHYTIPWFLVNQVTQLLRYGSEWHYRQNRIKSIFRLVKW